MLLHYSIKFHTFVPTTGKVALNFIDQEFGRTGLEQFRICVLFFDLLAEFILDLGADDLLILDGPPNGRRTSETNRDAEEYVL